MSKDVIDKLSDTIAIYKEESNIIAMGDFYVMLISAPVTCNGSALTFIPYTDASIEGLAEEGCNSHFHQISLFCIVQLTFLRYTLCKRTECILPSI